MGEWSYIFIALHIKGIMMSSLTYNIPYKSDTLPDQVLMDVSGNGDYQVIWNNTK